MKHILEYEKRDLQRMAAGMNQLGFNPLQGFLIQVLTESYYFWYLYVVKDESEVVKYMLESGYSSPILPQTVQKLKSGDVSKLTINDCLTAGMRFDDMQTWSVVKDIRVKPTVNQKCLVTFPGFDPYQTVEIISTYFEDDVKQMLSSEWNDDFEEEYSYTKLS
jgi:hypothetical protein